MVRTLRLKGTDIKVEAIEYRNIHGMGGMWCRYLNGNNKGSCQLIDGSCLCEEDIENY